MHRLRDSARFKPSREANGRTASHTHTYSDPNPNPNSNAPPHPDTAPHADASPHADPPPHPDAPSNANTAPDSNTASDTDASPHTNASPDPDASPNPHSYTYARHLQHGSDRRRGSSFSAAAASDTGPSPHSSFAAHLLTWRGIELRRHCRSRRTRGRYGHGRSHRDSRHRRYCKGEVMNEVLACAARLLQNPRAMQYLRNPQILADLAGLSEDKARLFSSIGKTVSGLLGSLTNPSGNSLSPVRASRRSRSTTAGLRLKGDKAPAITGTVSLAAITGAVVAVGTVSAVALARNRRAPLQ
jgi:hypothetical protein